MSVERQYVGPFEVDRVHFVDDSAEVCTEETCEEKHIWSVYIREKDPVTGHMLADWLSDHLTDELALAAANAYLPLFPSNDTEEKQ